MPSPSMNEDGNGGDDNDDDDDDSDDDDDNDDDEISSLLSSPDCSRLSQESQGVGPPRLSCKHLLFLRSESKSLCPADTFLLVITI